MEKIYILSIIVYIASSCCSRRQNNKCVECQPAFHLFRNNCIEDIINCIEYINGFDCIKCKQGFALNSQLNQCQLISSPEFPNIPENNFQRILLTENITEDFRTLIDSVEQNFVNSTGEIQITDIFVREPKPQQEITQELIRLIFVTQKGLLETVFSETNQTTNSSSLLQSVVIQRGPEEQFVTSFDEPMISMIIVSIQNNFQQTQNRNITILDAFSQNVTNQGANLPVVNYRLFFLNPDLGIIEISTQFILQQIGEIQSVIELNIDDLSPIIRSAVEQLKAINIPMGAELTKLEQIRVIINFQIQVSYNASFQDRSNLCLWIQFIIPEVNNVTDVPIILRQGECNLQPIITIPTECVVIPALLQNITFIREVSTDEFLLNQFKSKGLNTYLTTCGGFAIVPDLIDLAIGENQTMIFYYMVFQIFDLRIDRLILSAVQIKQTGNVDIIQFVRVPLQNIQTKSFTLGLPLQLQSQQQEFLQIFLQQAPELENAQLFQIQKTSLTNSAQYSYTFLFPKTDPFEEKQSVQYRLEVSQGDQQISILPRIVSPPPSYVQTDRFSQQIVNFIANQISLSLQIPIDEITFIRFFIDENQPREFLVYFSFNQTINVYIFTSSSDITRVQTIQIQIRTQFIDKQYISQNAAYTQIVFVINLLFQQSRILELSGANRTNRTNQIQDLVFFYKKEKIQINITIVNNITDKSYRFTQKISNIQEIQRNQSGYTLLSRDEFRSQFSNEYQIYLNVSPQENIQQVYTSASSILVIERNIRQIQIPFNHIFIEISSESQIEVAQIPPNFDANYVRQFLTRIGIPLIKMNLILKQVLKNPLQQLTQITYRIMSQQKVYILTYQQASQRRLLSFYLIQQKQQNQTITNVNETQIEVQQRLKIVSILNTVFQVINIIEIQIKNNVICAIVKQKKQGLLEIKFSLNEDNPQFMSIVSINKGFDLYGQSSSSLKLSAIQDYQSLIINKIEQFSEQKDPFDTYGEKTLILWKNRQITQNTTAIQLNYEFQNLSAVLKIFTLISFSGNQTNIYVVQKSFINNNLQQIREQNQLQKLSQVQEMRNDPLLKQIREKYQTLYWYYLKDASIFSIVRQQFLSEITYAIIYKKSRFVLRLMVSYDQKTGKSRILNFTPFLGLNINNESIYKCIQYNRSHDICQKCDSNFYLTTNNECIPEIQGCNIQSGSLCLLSLSCNI